MSDDGFGVSLIPTTLAATTLGRLAPGDVVNVEVDVLAKYVERLMTTGAIARRAAASAASTATPAVGDLAAGAAR